MEIKNKVVLITGGGKGIGRETAKLFAKNNMVIITGRTEKALKLTSDKINKAGGKCDYYTGDVTSENDCKYIIDEVIAKYGKIDILINNAGMSMRGLFSETTLDLFKKIININFQGAVNMSKFALDTITQNKGSIIFISSLSGLKGLPGIAPYGTAKMALTGFSDSLRCELHHLGLHVGIVYVGFTENDSNKTVYTATGDTVPINKRKNNDTQLGVAKSIYKCVAKRKNTMYLTGLGKVTQFVYRTFPRLSNNILCKYALNGYTKK